MEDEWAYEVTCPGPEDEDEDQFPVSVTFDSD